MTIRRAAHLLAALAALLMSGCLGQSGGPPSCAAPIHCVCGADLSHFIRGTVVSDSGPQEGYVGPGRNGRRAVQVQIDELPFPDRYPTLSPGMVIGGSLNWRSCTTPADYGVGTEVLVFDYQPWVGDDGRPLADDGFLTIGLDEGDSYNLGDEPTGSGRVLVSDIPMFEDVKVCEERLPPPPVQGSCQDVI